MERERGLCMVLESYRAQMQRLLTLLSLIVSEKDVYFNISNCFINFIYYYPKTLSLLLPMIRYKFINNGILSWDSVINTLFTSLINHRNFVNKISYLKYFLSLTNILVLNNGVQYRYDTNERFNNMKSRLQCSFTLRKL